MHNALENKRLPTSGTLKDSDFIRFSRQIFLPEVGETGQLALAQAHVVILGIGGLGQLAAHYLACAGVGHLTLIDGDTVEVSNLPRQLLVDDADIGLNKALVAKQKLSRMAPQCKISSHTIFFDIQVTRHLFDTALQAKVQGKAVLVLDCTDNFDTRQGINRLCIEAGLPLVSAAITAFSGQLFAVEQGKFPSGGCYHCIFPAETRVSQGCSTQGVLGPSVGVMASMQSLVAINLLLGIDTDKGELPSSLLGCFWCFDAKTLSWGAAKLTRDPYCAVCGAAERRVVNHIKQEDLA
jgi:sulfur carrier protein ThiS adenylyltransferase